MSAHWIEVTAAATEERDADYKLGCGGVTESCRTWTECRECEPTEEERDAGEYERHGAFHQLIAGDFMVPTDQCLLHALDVEGAWDIVEHGEHGAPLAVGRYPVVIEDAEEGTAYIALAGEVTR